ncbi:MAG: hypothetical protein LBB81_00555 [Treponema sp.]|jgi:ATP-dependent Lon protease|nr:hypothetical protein [Treponema sp.]
MLGVYKIEMQMIAGSGKFERTGIGSDGKAKEAVDSAYSYLKANARNISHSISLTTKDYLLHIQDLNGVGMTSHLTLPSIYRNMFNRSWKTAIIRLSYPWRP